jgi:hypothetical protein
MTPEAKIPTTKYDLLEKRNHLNREARRAYESQKQKKDKQYHLSRQESQRIMANMIKANNETSKEPT